MVVLDAGCGSKAPVLHQLADKVQRCIGIDLTDISVENIPDNMELLNANLEAMPIKSESIDMVISRSTLEHVKNTELLFTEISRVLRVGGCFIFLVPNLWDYVSLCSKIVPNKLHPLIMLRTEGRSEADTFPTYYRANTRRQITKLAAQSGMDIVSLDYLGQYPSQFAFSAVLFLLATAYEKLIKKCRGLRFLNGWLLGVAKKNGDDRMPKSDSLGPGTSGDGNYV